MWVENKKHEVNRDDDKRVPSNLLLSYSHSPFSSRYKKLKIITILKWENLNGLPEKKSKCTSGLRNLWKNGCDESNLRKKV